MMGPAIRRRALVDNVARRRDELVAAYMPMAARIARGFVGEAKTLTI
jgi:hypothetical protein